MLHRNLQDLQNIRQFILSQPLSATAYNELAKFLVASGKLDAAQRASHQTKILDVLYFENNEKYVPNVNSRIHEITNDKAKAQEVDDNQKISKHLVYGDNAFQSQDWLEAITHYQYVLAHDSNHIATKRKLAEALQNCSEKNLELAQKCYRDLEIQESFFSKQDPGYQRLIKQLYWRQTESQWQYASLLLAYLFVKILNSTSESSSKLLLTLNYIISSTPNNAILEDMTAIDVLKFGHQQFLEGDFQKAVSAYHSVFISLTKKIEEGNFQEPLEILMNLMDTLTYHSGCHISSLLAVVAGAIKYQETGQVSDFVHQVKIGLHCQTNAYFNDFVSWIISKISPPHVLNNNVVTGILGVLNQSDLNEVLKDINQTSYHIFEQKLPKNMCENLINFALITEGQLTIQGQSEPRIGLYDRRYPQADGCYFTAQDIIDNHEIQKLIIDDSLVSVARQHLQAEPIFANVSMWWSSAHSQQANSTMAQLYHFDMDWVKWTNFFFYLTPVDTNRGPHCYVTATHHRNSKPSQLLQRGYARISDSELRQYYPEESFVEILGDCGTIIVGDTRCYHKAKVPNQGDRLIINLTYTNTLALGGMYKEPVIKETHHPDFLKASQQNPHLFKKFNNVNNPL